MKPYGEGKAYGRIYDQAQAESIINKRKLIITEEKKARHDRAVIISDHRQAKILGMSYEEYLIEVKTDKGRG